MATVACVSFFKLTSYFPSFHGSTNGVPVVLLYLGFIGDTYFHRDYFQNADHWQRTMGASMSGILPIGLPGRFIEVPGGGSILVLVKSLPV
jgi:hypothetical protein